MTVRTDRATAPEDESRQHATWRALLDSLIGDSSVRTLPDVLARTAQFGCELIGCRYAVLAVVDETGALEHLIPAGVDPSAVQPIGRRPLRDGLLGTVIVESRTVRLPDEAVDASRVGLPAGHPVATSLLGVPLRDGARTIGALYLSQPEGGGAFTERQERTAELVAAAAAAAVSRARLARSAEQRQRWLTGSTELTRALVAGEHADPLRLVVDRVLAIAEAQLVCLIAQRPDGRSYQVVDAAGAVGDRVRGRVVDAFGPLAGEVIAEGRPRVFDNLRGESSRSELVELCDADSALLVPLSGPGVERGMLAVFRGIGRPAFTAAEVEASLGFATSLTLALQLAERRARREQVALLDERDRIARDLHDHVIQRLFAIGLTMQSVGTQVDEAAATRLLSSVDDIDETIARIRSTIYRLTGPFLPDEGSLRVRLSRVVDEVAVVLGFRPDLEFRGPVDFGVDELVAEDCVAVLREALTNVARHAQAGRAAVLVTATAETLTIQVSDDGRGISSGGRRSGLANLRARAEQHGGRLTITSERGQGTRLSWLIVLPHSGTVASAG